MKKNNLLKKRFVFQISQFIKSGDLKKKFTVIYLCSIIVFLIILIFGSSPTAGDTDTNLAAGSVLANGHLDTLRTPVYPLFLHFFKLIFGNGVIFKLSVIISQYLLFCITIFLFHSICNYFIKSKGLVFLLVLFYASYPSIIIWQKIIMTESLALSGMVFLLYYIVEFLKKKKFIYCLMINFILLILIFLRPAFLILIPVISAFWLYFIIKKQKTGYIGFGMNVMVIILMISYGWLFQKQYGVFTMSTVSDINQYMMMRDAGLIEIQNIDNVSLKKDVDVVIQKKNSTSIYFDEFIHYYTKYGYPISHKLVQESLKTNLSKYLSYSIKRFEKQTFISRIGFWSSLNYNKLNHIIKWISFPFIILYIFLLLYLLVIFKGQMHVKFSILIYAIAVLSLVTIIAGAPDSWGRLIVATIPIFIIMLGQCIELVYIRNTPFHSVSGIKIE